MRLGNGERALSIIGKHFERLRRVKIQRSEFLFVFRAGSIWINLTLRTLELTVPPTE